MSRDIIDVMLFMLYALLSASGGLGLALLFRIIQLTRRFTPQATSTLPGDIAALPTVSVCIPARNETHAMTQCLERVVASTYPKLEIIVLDDSSVDNTSILIKSFAHAGVRFVEGSPLPEGWIGKTHAQQELFRESSGEYILYMDVDTHLNPGSIDALVATALDKRASVVSVLPTRDDAWRFSVLFATLRYFWAILAHGQRYPAVSSSAWLVRRPMLESAFDGLHKLKMSTIPEREVARYAIDQKAYRFILSTDAVGVSYEKKWSSQRDTSVRLLYPLLGGRLTFGVLGLLVLGVLLAPFIIVVTALFSGWSLLHTCALLASLLLIASYMVYTSHTWRRGWIVGGALFPFVLAQEMLMLIQSIYAYHSGTVTWKGRPIQQTAQAAASTQQ